MELESFWRS